MDGSELAYIGLGANVGAARVAMVQAVAALAALPQCSLEAISPLYRTRPVGPVVQSDFLNAAAAVRVPGRDEPTQGAMELLVALKQIEGAIGRQERERWGPREIDLDLLLFGNHQLRVERDAAARSEDPAQSGPQWLEVPHPSASERLFVLAPLADLAPRLEPPGWGLSVAAARDLALEVEEVEAVRTIAAWDPAGGEWLDLSTA